MALLTPQQIDIDGLEPVFAAASAGGDTVSPDDRVYVEVINGDGTDTTVTVVVPGTTYAQANPDVAVVVTAGERRKIGPFPRAIADTDGLVDLTYSKVTSLTVGAFRI